MHLQNTAVPNSDTEMGKFVKQQIWFFSPWSFFPWRTTSFPEERILKKIFQSFAKEEKRKKNLFFHFFAFSAKILFSFDVNQ